MARTPHLLAALVLAVASVASCGGDDAEGSTRADTIRLFADTLRESGQLDEQQARCVAGRIVDRVGENEVRALLDDPGGDGPDEDLVAETASALGACGVATSSTVP